MPHAKPPELDAILWMCRRGMLELDLILANFAKTHYCELDDAEKIQFVALLRYDDPVLYDLLVRQIPQPNQQLAAIIRRVLAK